MNKAEKRAEEYCHSTLVCSSYIKKMAYLEGHHQAEKDLELTWEDMRELYIIFAEVDTEIELCKANDIKAETIGYYQEVLKRFKDFRERKEK